MNEAKYNGWSNRETWLASLWLTNDPVSYLILIEALAIKGSDFEKAEWLQIQLQNEMYDLSLPASLWADLLGTSLARVNFREVIEQN